MEKLHEKMENVMMEMLEGIRKNGVDSEATTKLVTNYTKLYELRQKDLDREAKYDDLHEKLAYENGRADLELRVKEESFKAEQRKLDLEEQRLEMESKVKEQAVKNEQKKLELDEKKLDLELRTKEDVVKNEQRKLELEEKKLILDEKKIDTDLVLAEAKMKSERADSVVTAIGRGLNLAFRTWLSSSLMYYDVTGHVVGSFLGKKVLDKWATTEEKF